MGKKTFQQQTHQRTNNKQTTDHDQKSLIGTFNPRATRLYQWRKFTFYYVLFSLYVTKGKRGKKEGYFWHNSKGGYGVWRISIEITKGSRYCAKHYIRKLKI